MSPVRFSRRDFLACAAVLVAGAACSSKPAPTGPRPLSLESSDSPVRPGWVDFGFELLTANGSVVSGGEPEVSLALGTRKIGPFPATWYAFTGYARFQDRSPRSPLPGTYSSRVQVPSPGNWQVTVTATGGGQRATWAGRLPVTNGPVPAQIGTKAISVATPVATSEAKLLEICTRQPPDHMHYISLDQALRNGKPTVVTFATPLLCESRLCGPVVDEELGVFTDIGRGQANFIHVEEFLPGPDHKPPAPTAENASPAFRAWGFQTEPWTVLIDRQGIIRSRFEGPAVDSQIRQALQPLL